MGGAKDACGAEAAFAGGAKDACGAEAPNVGGFDADGEDAGDCAAHDETRRTESNTGSRAIVYAPVFNSFA